ADVLARLLDDPLARTLDLEASELAALRSEPRLASTIAALFHLYKNTRAQLDRALSRLEAASPAAGASPVPLGYAPGDEVTDFLESHRNYFPELEEAAAEIRRDAGLPRRFVSDQLIQFLRKRKRKGLEVIIEPPRGPSSVVR